jgi:drug/metabolite transporter (DMT)-like permease
MSHSRQPSSLALVIGFALVYFSWGTTYLPTRIAVHGEHMPPLLFGGSRVFCGGMLLLLYQLVSGARVRLRTSELAKLMLASGLLFVCGAGLMNAASATVTSGMCAVLAATTPLWLGLFAMLWPHGERLTPRGWLGLFVGLTGVLILLAPELAAPGQFAEHIGIIFALGSAVSWAVGSLILRHLRLATAHLTAAAYQMIFGGVGLTFVGILLGEPRRWPEQMSPAAIQAFLYLLLFGSLIGFVAFNWLLAHVAAAKVGTYAYVNPVIAVLVGTVVGKEEFSLPLVLGIYIILLGVFLVRGGERPPTVAAPAQPAEDGISDEDWKLAQASEP